MPAAARERRLSLFSIFFTFFVDNLSWAIVFPIFAPFFLDPENKLFSPDVSVATRTTLLGCFLAAFPLAQFFGSPLIGEFADRKGRRKGFLLSIFFSILALALSAFGMQKKMLVLLFLSRAATGFFSGNLSICLAGIADLSKTEESKVKNFGYLAAIAGFSFIIGTFLGGKLSDPTVSASFHPAFPLWIATALMALDFLFVLFAFRETQHLHKEHPFDPLGGVHNIQEVLKKGQIKILYAIYFLFLFSWNILLQFTPVRVIEVFDFTNSEIGDLAAFMGICWAVGSGLISKLLLKKFSPLKVLEFSLLVFTILCTTIFFQKHLQSLLLIIGFCVLLAGVAWPICAQVISSKAHATQQGKMLGISQSMQSLAMALSPLVAVFSHIHLGVPFLIAALASFGAAAIYFRLKPG